VEVDELGAVGHGIDVRLHLEIAVERADVADVDDGAPAEVPAAIAVEKR
jgi:hypothetical protein